MADFDKSSFSWVAITKTVDEAAQRDDFDVPPVNITYNVTLSHSWVEITKTINETTQRDDFDVPPVNGYGYLRSAFGSLGGSGNGDGTYLGYGFSSSG